MSQKIYPFALTDKRLFGKPHHIDKGECSDYFLVQNGSVVNVIEICANLVARKAKQGGRTNENCATSLVD